MTIYLVHELKLGTKTRRFHYRKNRSDQVVITQMFVDQHYALERIKRAPELHNFVQGRLALGLI